MRTQDQLRLARILTLSLVIVALFLMSAHAALAQSEETSKTNPEVQQLKQRLLQLEQTVQQLKAQIDSAEETQKKTGTASGEKISAPASTSAATIKPASTSPTTGTPQDDTSKGESTFDVYGFVMLDAGYQFKQADPNWFDTVRPVKLPAFRNQFLPNGNTYFSVRQTRFGVKSSTPTKYGPLITKFEFELFGTGADAGQTTFRLRHAYGELGHFGAGQNWSTFVDPDVFPNTNEYWGPNGIAWFRNVQFRWMPIKGRTSVTIALERPGASADLGLAAERIQLQGVRPRFPLPDLTGNVRVERNWGHVQVAGIVRHMKWVDTVADN